MLPALVATGTAPAQSSGPTDGTLSVKNADGKVVFNGKGLAIGRLDKGQVTIKDPNPYDGSGPIVTGADSVQALGERTTRYSGTKIRFRIIGGAFTLIVFGTNIDVSVVGRGLVTLDGLDDNTDASFAVNGADPEPFPLIRYTFPLAAPPPGPGSGG
jgi:hypothetical protein